MYILITELKPQRNLTAKIKPWVNAVTLIFCCTQEELNKEEFNSKMNATQNRRKRAVYHTIMLCEDLILMSIWYVNCDESDWYRQIAMVGYYVLFILGLFFMVSIFSLSSFNIDCYASF